MRKEEKKPDSLQTHKENLKTFHETILNRVHKEYYSKPRDIPLRGGKLVCVRLTSSEVPKPFPFTGWVRVSRSFTPLFWLLENWGSDHERCEVFLPSRRGTGSLRIVYGTLNPDFPPNKCLVNPITEGWDGYVTLVDLLKFLWLQTQGGGLWDYSNQTRHQTRHRTRRSLKFRGVH